MDVRGQDGYTGAELLLTIEHTLQSYNRWIVGMIVAASEIKGGARILDFGSGIGTLSGIFQSLTGIKPEGVELDSALAKIMEARGYQTYPSLAATNGTYDLIFISNVLEHLPDDEKILREFRSKLAVGGVVAVYAPAFRALWSSMDDAMGHYRRYKKQDLATKLRNSGFMVTESRYCDCVGFFATLLFQFAGRGKASPSKWSLRFFDRYLLPVSKVLDRFTGSFMGKNVIAFAKADES